MNTYAHLCIHQLIEMQAIATPNAVAIEFQGQHLTYQALNEKANQLAHYLQTLGVQPETLVGVCVERSIEMVIALLGILKAGGAYIPIDPAYPSDRIAFMIEDSQLPVLVTQRSFLADLPECTAKVVDLEQNWQAIEQQQTGNLDSGVVPANLAYTIYTSGSTGKPKGVQIIHSAVVNFLLSMQAAPGIAPQDVLLAVTTISFDIAVLELFLPLTVGAQVTLVDRQIAADALQLSQLISASNATIIQATPATWRLLLAAGWQGNASLKLLCGGEAMTQSLAELLLQRCGSLWNMYGPTETTIWSMVHQVETSSRPVPLGSAIANTEIYLIREPARRKDDPLELAAIGEDGELYIGGQGVARGYLNRPDLTEERFIPDPFSPDPTARLYKTGDLARRSLNHEIEIIGRVDHQVKIRGYRIELGEIEAVLSQHPDIREVAVLAIADAPGEKRLVAYVVLKLGAPQLRSTEIRIWLRDKLPEYMIPAVIIFMDSLPLTPNCKVDRRSLPAPSLDAQEELTAPQTEMEQQLAPIWTSVLGLEVGIYQHFFESGGDSVRAAMLLSRVREELGVELALEYLFKAPTMAEFAKVVEAVQLSGSATGLKTTPAELWADTVLDTAITPKVQSSIAMTTESTPKIDYQHFFLTGATGFIGAFLIAELLQRSPQATVYCLVRADNLTSAIDRLRNSLANYEIWQESFGSRIIPVLGDLSQPLFGLTEQQFSELADRIDCIYHSGAYVNLIYPYTALRQANVIGTQEVLRLATLARPIPVHYISTIDVFHAPEYHNQQLILESDELLSCEGYLEGYAQSKWVAEKLVMAARDRGLPVCIYRLGMITGHSKTGGFQLDNLICRLIKGFIQLGCAPDLQLPMVLAPVDYIVQAIAHLSHQPESFGKKFHLVSPHVLTLEQLVAGINELGYTVATLPYAQWQAKLLTMPPDNVLTPVTAMFASSTHPQQSAIEVATFTSQAFDLRNTQVGLAETNIVCPALNPSVLQVYLAYFQRTGFLPQPLAASIAHERS